MPVSQITQKNTNLSRRTCRKIIVFFSQEVLREINVCSNRYVIFALDAVQRVFLRMLSEPKGYFTPIRADSQDIVGSIHSAVKKYIGKDFFLGEKENCLLKQILRCNHHLNIYFIKLNLTFISRKFTRGNIIKGNLNKISNVIHFNIMSKFHHYKMAILYGSTKVIYFG